MTIGLIGLGKMGHAIAYRLVKGGFKVYGFDFDVAACASASALGVEIDIEHNRSSQKNPPVLAHGSAGKPVDDVLLALLPACQQEDIIIDGGNSKFHDTLRRGLMLRNHHIRFLDCGTSGGIHGKEHGFSLMVGGDQHIYKKALPILEALAAPNGVALVGPSGAGHYVKMVHNGIEYALMQAYGEGFQLIKEGSFARDNLDLATITNVWNHGAVIRSWLCELAHETFKHDQELKNVGGDVEESGTGQWTVEEAHAANVPVTLIEDALKIRKESRKTGGTYATKVVALLRNAFGGHSYTKI